MGSQTYITKEDGNVEEIPLCEFCWEWAEWFHVEEEVFACHDCCDYQIKKEYTHENDWVTLDEWRKWWQPEAIDEEMELPVLFGSAAEIMAVHRISRLFPKPRVLRAVTSTPTVTQATTPSTAVRDLDQPTYWGWM